MKDFDYKVNVSGDYPGLSDPAAHVRFAQAVAERVGAGMQSRWVWQRTFRIGRLQGYIEVRRKL